jgi:hypothetical protein
MHVIKLLAALGFVTLAGCAEHVPPEKSAYVGEWQEKTMYLYISQDGLVKYERVNGGSKTTLNGPLKAFIGDDFEVGVGPMSTTFVVSKPPYRDGDVWKMVVDQVELTRVVE